MDDHTLLRRALEALEDRISSQDKVSLVETIRDHLAKPPCEKLAGYILKDKQKSKNSPRYQIWPGQLKHYDQSIFEVTPMFIKAQP